MAYSPNIPQPSDRLSVSQGDLLTNFGQLNTVYQVDHFAYDDATADATKHRRIVLPDQAATPPTPAASNGALYANTAVAITRPFWRRDGLAGSPEFSLMGIRAFGSPDGTGNAFLGTPMNFTSVAYAAGVYTFTMPANVVSGTTYSVIASTTKTVTNNERPFHYYEILSATQFTIKTLVAANAEQVQSLSVVVLQF